MLGTPRGASGCAIHSGTARIVLVLGLLLLFAGLQPARAAEPCDPAANPVVCENLLPGTPASEWDIIGNGDLSIQGFATDMSVNVGERIGFKVDTDAAAYELLIYRLGWYGGDGARLVDTVTPSARLPQQQPECLEEADTYLLDCGNWALSASWDVPPDAVSGVYLARLRRTDTGGDSHIVFVVRDDARSADVLFQTSDTTWQAYNNYGERSLYFGGPAGRAYKVSYNRPMYARGGTPDGRDSFFGSEYAMLRWLERNGYDVSYLSGVDTDRGDPSLLLNYDVFLSVGHDEYWSGRQRDHVEAARDAGVNLIFASGNEVYWKTRWEPSIDGSGTAHRTLVSYKETKDTAKIDPSPEWTGTWRDPRFSPPADGGRPENALTGTLFTVNCCTYALKVPAEYRDLRFWRNTEVAALAPGAEAVFPVGTLGYEWDEDPDNGFRPAGAFRMSKTTETVQERLIDFGQTVAVEPATHHLVMHRAASGALVFGAGTVQWSWGLDDYHDGLEAPVVPAMQQATVNVLADMGVQPQTLENGLLAASPSTDTTPPGVAISAPSAGTTLQHGKAVTITGTASDSGGVVAAVEVSLDGGNTWHPAEGRESWSYTGYPGSLGAQTFMARAVDDSANLGSTSRVSVDVTCPCSLFGDRPPERFDTFDTSSPLELGVRFKSDIDGYVTGVRFYQLTADSAARSGSLWATDGTLLATGSFAATGTPGWQALTFSQPVAITAGTAYIASYFAPSGYIAQVDRFLGQQTLRPPLRAETSTATAPNGVFSAAGTSSFPNQSFGATNYWVDVVFTDIAPPDTNPPSVVATSPADGTSSVATGTTIEFVLDESIDPAATSLTVTDSQGTAVPGSIVNDTDTLTTRFVPDAALVFNETYSATGRFSDPAGNRMAEAVTISFRTQLPDGAVNALWDDSAQPDNADSGDTGSIEVGTKFTADQDIEITGVRFYKSVANTGTHVGSLWNAEGTLLAQATFVNESRSGWQQVSFSEAVTITQGQTYVVSYLAPEGHYSVTGGYFAIARQVGPLTALAAGPAGGNGVYRYGDGGFPTASYNQSNYWVSPVYRLLPDTRPPVLSATTPAAGASSVPLDAPIAATFDEAIDPTTLQISLSDAAGTPVDGTVDYDDTAMRATFSPVTSLATDTAYEVRLSVSDLAGNATVAPLAFGFRTRLPAGAVAALWDDAELPAVIDSGDTASVELGTKFVADRDVAITGLRFYKSVDNTGVHIGSLWDDTGTRLAEVTFENETTAGWQSAEFAEAVIIEADRVYRVSYLAPDGHYSATPDYFSIDRRSGPLTAPASDTIGGNGVYAYGDGGFPNASANRNNYWVTPVYELLPDTQPPGLLATTPLDGASSVPVDSELAVTFDEPVAPASVSLVVTDADGTAVSGTLSYDDTVATATFAPDAPLQSASRYTVSATATDLAGNATPAPLQFAFATSEPDGAIAALWNDSTRPATLDSGDTSAVEVGTKFFASRDLDITGIRFYKSASNTGTHRGSLWTESGELLAQLTFTDETSAGWQQALFDQPVRITADTVYVVSYYAPAGHYSATSGYFEQSHSLGPLIAPAADQVDGNGVYRYGAGGFPSASAAATNYWVSVVYAEPDDVSPPQLIESWPAAGASSVPVDTVLTADFDEAVVADSVRLEVTDTTTGSTVSGSTVYDAGSQSVSFEPDAPLALDTLHTVAVSATDLVGNATAEPLRYTFRTSLPDGALQALWDDSVVPDGIDSGDASSIVVGTTFVASEDLDITGLRFYKALANTGTHTGSLWRADGALLAQVTFTGESSTGWQQAEFAEPVRILANQRYVISYLAPDGHYSATGGYFEQSRTSGPLTALASSAASGNGVYDYGNGGFPTSSFNSTNYWVTPLYERLPPPTSDGLALWDYTSEPDSIDSGDVNSIEVGTRFLADTDLDIVGLRFYKSSANTGVHVGSLWDSSGALLAQVVFENETSTGWQEARFAEPVRIVAGESYIASYLAPNGHYSFSGGYFAQSLTSGLLTAPASTDASPNGVYRYGDGGFPSSSYNQTNYWVSPVYQ